MGHLCITLSGMQGWRKNEREEKKREEYTGILYIRKKEERETEKEERSKKESEWVRIEIEKIK